MKSLVSPPPKKKWVHQKKLVHPNLFHFVRLGKYIPFATLSYPGINASRFRLQSELIVISL